MNKLGSYIIWDRQKHCTVGGRVAGLKKANIEIDRRVLADLAVFDKPAFTAIVGQAKASLAA